MKFIIESEPAEAVRRVALVREGNDVAIFVDGIRVVRLDASFREARMYSDAARQCGLTAVLAK